MDSRQWFRQMKKNTMKKWFRIQHKKNIDPTSKMIQAFNDGFKYGWKARQRWEIKQMRREDK